MHKGCAYRNEATWRRFWCKRRSKVGRFATVRVPEGFLLSVRTNSITVNFFLYWKLGPMFVFVVIQGMFSSWVHQRTLRLLFKDCRSFYFHSLIKATFLVSKGLLCLYDKQKTHGCLQIWNFSYCVQVVLMCIVVLHLDDVANMHTLLPSNMNERKNTI